MKRKGKWGKPGKKRVPPHRTRQLENWRGRLVKAFQEKGLFGLELEYRRFEKSTDFADRFLRADVKGVIRDIKRKAR